MIYLQHNDPNVCVPQHISKYGLYSANFFLLNAICNYLYNYNWLTFVAFSLYTTTILHWYKIKHNGIFKIIDVITCIITMSSVSFYDSLYFCLQHRKLWFLSAFVSVVAYILNKYIEFYQQSYKGSNYFLANEPYRYFSFKYTYPNTLQRELSYKYSVFVHIIFLHINLSCACIYGVVNSQSCSNYYITN
jgi:hypothetical protein